MKYKYIFIDIDGVLRDFVAKLREVFKREFPAESILREDKYDLRHWSTLGENIFPWVTEGAAAKEIFLTAPHYEKAVEALRDWISRPNAGVKFALITRQRNERIQWTRQWLANIGINGSIPVYYTIEKSLVIEAVIQAESRTSGVEITLSQAVLLDDSPMELTKARSAGIIPICISRSWNTEWEGERIGDLSEFNPFE